MTISTLNGTTVFISSATVTDTTDTITEFAALTWTEIGEVENIGAFGDSSNEVTFANLKNGRVRKYKGMRNAGTTTLTVGADPADAGQDAMDAAQEYDGALDYAFKFVYNDAITFAGTPTIKYARGKVMSAPVQNGGSDTVNRKQYNIGINSKLYEKPAT